MLEREVLESTKEVVAKKPHANGTLAGSLNGAELSDRERRAILAAEALPVDLDAKRLVAAADIFIASGMFRASEVLGVGHEDAIVARDAVRTDPRLEITWAQFELLKEPLFAEVAIYKKGRVSEETIAQYLQVDPKDVSRTVQVLYDYGILGDRKTLAQIRHIQDQRRVAKIDGARKQLRLRPLSKSELGHRIGRSGYTVGKLRGQNRARGEASTAGASEILERGEKIRRVILKNPKLSALEVWGLLDPSVRNVVSPNAIEHQRKVLIKKTLLDGKRRAVNKGMSKEAMRQRTAEVRAIFAKALAMSPKDVPVVIADFRSTVPGLSNVPKTTLVPMYHSLAEEQEVPPLKLNRTRKSKRR